MSKNQTTRRRAAVLMNNASTGIPRKTSDRKAAQDSRPELFGDKDADSRRIRAKVKEALRRGKYSGSRAFHEYDR